MGFPLGSLGGVAYGVARGSHDAERMRREDEAHEGDQAIRRERLLGEQELKPLRRRTLELGVEQAEQEALRRPDIQAADDELRALNIDIAQMTKKEKEEISARLAKSRGDRDSLTQGLRKFRLSADPQHVVDAVEGTFAEADQDKKGAKARRDGDDIVLELPGGKLAPQKFTAKKDKAGNMRSADEWFSIWAANELDPVGRLQKDLEEEYGLAKEAARTDRAFGVADRRSAAQVEAARERGSISRDRLSEAWYNRQHGQVDRILDGVLKPETSPSGFAAAYAFDSDKSLRGLMREKIEGEIENNVPAAKAVNNVVNDLRAGYDRLDKEARVHAQALGKEKIKATDRKAVEAAATAGNENAKKLLRIFEIAQKNLGYSAAKALESQLPTTGK